jgi:hypothetical protein
VRSLRDDERRGTETSITVSTTMSGPTRRRRNNAEAAGVFRPRR